LHVFTRPADNKLRLPGLLTGIQQAYLLADSSQNLSATRESGTTIISLPDRALDASDTVVVAKLTGAPKVSPPVLTQGTDSPFELDYAPAITTGKAVKRFNREGKFHIAKWSGPQDSIAWRLLVSQTGEYHVRIKYSARRESQGAKFVVTIGDETVSGEVVPTGEGYSYRTFDLGTVKLTKAGSYTLQIKPGAEYSHNLMFFQSLELEPSGPLMVE
jgi:hypothetical protein